MRRGHTFDDVLLVPQLSDLASRYEADIASQVFSGFWVDLPIISANMPSVTGSEMAMAMRMAGGYSILPRVKLDMEKQISEYRQSPPDTCVSIGVKGGMHDVDKFNAYGANIFCLDVAHGDHKLVHTFVLDFKFNYPEKKIIVGNIATYEAAVALCDLGVDAIKVGIGPGAACITREVTGFGVPQLTAIMDVYDALKNYPTRLIADGGIKTSGDIVKALAAGADTVMVGGLLAGCDESPNPGTYYGNASNKVNGHRAPEGVEGSVPTSGSVIDVLKKLAWGIKSGFSYGGARTIAELQENADWIAVSPQTALESSARLWE